MGLKKRKKSKSRSRREKIQLGAIRSIDSPSDVKKGERLVAKRKKRKTRK